MEPRLFDAHCHLDLMAHPDAVADEATALGLGLFDCGVDPRDFANAHGRTRRPPTVIKGIGLHPWWLADERCGNAEIDLLCQIAAQERFVGEVGLDFSARLPEVSRYKYRHLTGSAIHSCSALLPGA